MFSHLFYLEDQDMEDVLQAISTLGFPIAAYIGLFWYINKRDEQHKEEIGLLTQAIQNNTLVMTELKDRLEDRRV